MRRRNFVANFIGVQRKVLVGNEMQYMCNPFGCVGHEEWKKSEAGGSLQSLGRS